MMLFMCSGIGLLILGGQHTVITGKFDSVLRSQQHHKKKFAIEFDQNECNVFLIVLVIRNSASFNSVLTHL